MKFKTRSISIIILSTITLLSCVNKSTISTKKKSSKTSYNEDATTVKFKGVITNINYDCHKCGVCSIEVNNKWWIAISYGKRNPSSIPKERGLVTGIRFSKEDYKMIGKRVKVHAKIRYKNRQTEDEYKNRLTVEGNNNYYVEVIE